MEAVDSQADACLGSNLNVRIGNGNSVALSRNKKTAHKFGTDDFQDFGLLGQTLLPIFCPLLRTDPLPPVTGPVTGSFCWFRVCFCEKKSSDGLFRVTKNPSYGLKKSVVALLARDEAELVTCAVNHARVMFRRDGMLAADRRKGWRRWPTPVGKGHSCSREG